MPSNYQPDRPTWQEIQERSAVIRQSWDEREHRRRAGVDPEPGWMPPGTERVLRADVTHG